MSVWPGAVVDSYSNSVVFLALCSVSAEPKRICCEHVCTYW